jgi:polyferredoxin
MQIVAAAFLLMALVALALFVGLVVLTAVAVRRWQR